MSEFSHHFYFFMKLIVLLLRTNLGSSESQSSQEQLICLRTWLESEAINVNIAGASAMVCSTYLSTLVQLYLLFYVFRSWAVQIQDLLAFLSMCGVSLVQWLWECSVPYSYSVWLRQATVKSF